MEERAGRASDHDQPTDPLAGVAALDHPVRRRLHRLLLGSGAWTSRDQAAAALELPRSVAAFHLDKLADAGVLEVRFERTTGRRGPGAGRPAKLYRPASAELAVSVPSRRYELAGSLLAAAVDRARTSGEPVDACLHEVAREEGRRIGAAEPDVAGALVSHGYEPEHDGDEIVLRNCPFHRLAEAHRALVCGMNLDLLTGVLDGAGAASTLGARLDPQPGCCCVRIAPAAQET